MKKAPWAFVPIVPIRDFLGSQALTLLFPTNEASNPLPHLHCGQNPLILALASEFEETWPNIPGLSTSHIQPLCPCSLFSWLGLASHLVLMLGFFAPVSKFPPSSLALMLGLGDEDTLALASSFLELTIPHWTPGQGQAMIPAARLMPSAFRASQGTWC